MRLTLQEIAAATQGELVLRGNAPPVFEKLSTDTRALKGGEIFLALRGDNFNGNRFAPQAIQAGAKGLIVEKSARADVDALQVPIVFVEEGQRALGDLAAYWRKRFSIPVVAIAGSNGKTTTRGMTGALLSSHLRLHQTPGNFNNLVGLPLTLLGLQAEHEAVVLEMGMNAAGEVARLTQIAQPTVGLITNIGPEHMEFLKTIENVAKAEGELFAHLPEGAVALVNADDPYCANLADQAQIPLPQRVTFGWKKSADIAVERVDQQGIRGSLVIVRDCRKNAKLTAPLELHLPLPGEHNVSNLLAAVSIALTLSVPPHEIERGVESIQPVGSRTRILELQGGSFVLDDCYNANPPAMKSALRLLANLSGGRGGVAVLGEMLELGETAESAHRELGRQAAESGVGELFLVGPHAAQVAEGAKKAGMNAARIHLIFELPGKPPDAAMERVALEVRKGLKKSHWVLVKGSRGMALERLVEKLAIEPGLAEKKSETER